MRHPKHELKTRLEIGRAKLSGKDPKELAAQYGLGLTTVYRYADEAESFQQGGTFTEFGVSGLNRFGGSIQEDYDKSWRSLKDLVAVVKEMMDHPIVGAAMFTIEMSVRRAEWTVTPGGDSANDVAAAEFLEQCMHDMSHAFDDHIAQVISMFAYGFAPFEITYKRRLGRGRTPSSKFEDGRIGWRKFAFRSQDTLTPGKEWLFDEAGGIQGLYQQAPPDYKERFIPIERLLLYRTTSAKNNPQGRSSLRSAFSPWYYSKNLTNVEAISAERMGAGLPVIYLGEGTSKKGDASDFGYAKQVVRDTRADEQAGLVFPYQKQGADGKGILFELVSPPAKGNVDFHQTITRHNQQIAQSLLAQFIFLGLSEYGTQALATELKSTFAEAVTGWLKNIAATLNSFAVPRLFALNNFNVEILPELSPGDVGDIDVRTLIESVSRAADSGVLQIDEGTERRIRSALRIPQRDEEQAGELLFPPAPPKAPPLTPAEVTKEVMSRVRGRGRRAAQPWEKTVNDYQRELRARFDQWAEETANDLAEADEDDRDEMLLAALLLLERELSRTGRNNILDAVAEGVGDDPFRREYIDVAGSHMASNERYLSGFMRDMRLGIRDLLGIGLVGFALRDRIIDSYGARTEQYAGEAWGALQETVGERSETLEDPRVYWRLDMQAEHCDVCLEYGENEYASYHEMLAQTGGSAPGINTTCDGNCRCSLETITEGGFGRLD